MSKMDFTEFISTYHRPTGEQREVPFGESLEARVNIQLDGFDVGYDAKEYLAPALENLYEATAWLHEHGGETVPVTPIPDFLAGWGWFNPEYLAEDEIAGLIYGFEGSAHVIITLVK